MRNILSQLIDDSLERELPEFLPREASAPQVKGRANAVIGMRRSGKTWFCYQQIMDLMNQGVERNRLLYLNFEDERLLPFSARDFQLILETYYQKYPGLKERQCHLFLDEVHRIDGWDKFVRRILDSERLNVWVTGSSSRLLSSEIATSLRGRSLTTEIFPFSFREFLSFHEVDTKTDERFSAHTRAILQNMVERYLVMGGFPEIQRLDEELRRTILQNYLDVVILRDVIERHSVSNTVALRAMIRHIVSAPATRFSVNKFFNSLRSQSITCTKNSLYDFLNHLTDAFLLYQVSIHSRSEKVRQVNPKKIYVIDTGLLHAMSLQLTEDQGALLENMVYMHLRRQGLYPEYYVTEGGAEVDFVFLPKDKSRLRLIQVCWDIGNTETRAREFNALLSTMKELKVRDGTIVTWMDEDTTDDRINVVPIWKWLLRDEESAYTMLA